MPYSTEYIEPILHRAEQYIPHSVAVQAASYFNIANTHFQSMRDTYVEPYVLRPLDTMLNSPPDLFSILVLLALFVVSLKILDYTRRVITFWVVLVFRLAFWGSVLGVVWYAYSVGWEKASRDAVWAFGLLEGFVQELLAANAGGKGSEGAGSFMSQSRSPKGAQSRWL